MERKKITSSIFTSLKFKRETKVELLGNSKVQIINFIRLHGTLKLFTATENESLLLTIMMLVYQINLEDKNQDDVLIRLQMYQNIIDDKLSLDV